MPSPNVVWGCLAGGTVKPNNFVFPLFCEFRDLSKFAKTMGSEYLKVITITVLLVVQQAKCQN